MPPFLAAATRPRAPPSGSIRSLHKTFGRTWNIHHRTLHMSGESLLVILVVGFIAGWLASQVVQGTGFGLIGDRTAGGTVMRDLFEHDDGGWLQDPALLDRLVIKELQAKAETVRSEGWRGAGPRFCA